MIISIIKIMPQADPLWRKLTASMTVLAICVFIGGPGRANNISVTNVSGVDRVKGSHWMVQFDVSWTNSWRCDLAGAGQSAPYNYDAAWVFVKYRISGTSDWRHATLSTNIADHVAPTGSIINVGLDGRTGAWGTNGVGAFIYRSANGSNMFAANGTRLRWNYAADGVADVLRFELKVCAIEMVYVSTGAFYVGSTTGGTEDSHFYAGSLATLDTNTPFQITNEDYQIEIGDAVGKLYYISNSVHAGDQAGILSNAFPKGYSAFYGMKYEISQAQYVDFLNTLTRNQQTNRFVSTTLSNFMYSASGQTTPANRNGVQLISTNDPAPRVYANNLDIAITNSPNSTNDGQWIACNYLSWADLTAYLDWAGLRPMTELEYEKACRGTNYPVANEYAFGGTRTGASSITYGGTANEKPGNASGNCNYWGYLTGPMRVGCMGIGTGTRVGAGASYYGMTEMSGNVSERHVTVGKVNGRVFTGQHGNGTLSSAGDADVALWPGTDADGAGSRGNSWQGETATRVADRNDAAYTTIDRAQWGGRGVRTTP